MITFQTQQGRCVPVVVCEICQQEIEGADTTDLLYRSMCDLAAVQHFHPGACHAQGLARQELGRATVPTSATRGGNPDGARMN